MSGVLARRDAAFSPEEVTELLRERLGDEVVVGTRTEYGTFTLEVDNESLARVAEVCRDERVLAYDLFDCLFGIDAREEGFDVVAILYSTSTGNRICLRTRCPGGREAPTCPTLTGLYRGADWHERETWDMFGIEFTGHPGLEPRILTVENFEGWPLRKDFHLASRVVKPWPGVKEPAELDEDGNVIERVPRLGDAPGPYELDKAMAEQAKLANPAPETPAETEEVSEEKPEPKAEDKPESGIDQATYDALIAEGKSERIARSKAKAAFVKKQRQQAADDASDEVAETESGKAVAQDAERAETADDSGQVLSGDVEQQAEEAEAQATEASKEAAGQAEHEQAEAAAEQVEASEVSSDEAEAAADKAEAKRKAAAEARARKAEERARAAEQDEAGEGGGSDSDDGGQPGEEDA